MTRSIFVNTTGWLALYNPNDPNHDAVVQLWEDLRRAPGEPARFVCTDYVLDQVFTALKVFGSLHAAQAFNQLITNSELVRLFMTDSVIFDRAWEVFVGDEHPRWTFRLRKLLGHPIPRRHRGNHLRPRLHSPRPHGAAQGLRF